VENVAKLEAVKSETVVTLPRETCLELDNLQLRMHATTLEHSIRMRELQAARETAAELIRQKYGVDVRDPEIQVNLHTGECVRKAGDSE